MVDDFSIQEAWIGVWAGVMESVSGFRLTGDLSQQTKIQIGIKKKTKQKEIILNHSFSHRMKSSHFFVSFVIKIIISLLDDKNVPSWSDGKIRILSIGRRDNRSLNPPAIVLTARRKLEQTSFDLGAPGSARKMAMCIDSGTVLVKS